MALAHFQSFLKSMLSNFEQRPTILVQTKKQYRGNINITNGDRHIKQKQEAALTLAAFFYLKNKLLKTLSLITFPIRKNTTI